MTVTSDENDNGDGGGNASNGMDVGMQIRQTMKRAFNNHILQQISNDNKNDNNSHSYSYAVLHPLIIEIHNQLRGLIPNRTDLHSILDDNSVQRTCHNANVRTGSNDDKSEDVYEDDSFEKIMGLLKNVAQALIMLESEERSASTDQWISTLNALLEECHKSIGGNGSGGEDEDESQSESPVDQMICIPIPMPLRVPTNASSSSSSSSTLTMCKLKQKEWVVASMTFLHRKAEQCQTDIHDYQLGHVVAPALSKDKYNENGGNGINTNEEKNSASMGKEFLEKEFEIQFGRRNRHGSGDGSEGEGEGGVQVVVLPHLKTWLNEIVQASPYNIRTNDTDTGTGVGVGAGSDTNANTVTTREELMESKEKRCEAIVKTGWVDNILFRTPREVHKEDPVAGTGTGALSDESQGEHHGEGEGEGEGEASSSPSESASTSPSPFYMPEIFYLDIAAVQTMRMSTKLSVLGSALALHASSIAGVSVSMSGNGSGAGVSGVDVNVKQCRTRLIEAMSGKGYRMRNRDVSVRTSVSTSTSAMANQELLEEDVTDAVLDLARVWNPNLALNTNTSGGGGDYEVTRNRCVATMRGTDPVLRLLDRRMRDVFRKMMMFDPQQSEFGSGSGEVSGSDSYRQEVPATLRTGIRSHSNIRPINSTESVGTRTYSNLFKRVAKEELIKKGFAFYAEELVETALMACRIVNLALYVHGPSVEGTFMDVLCE